MPKGQKFGGRVKGTPNKTTSEIREAYQEFVEGNIENLNLWMNELDAPEKRLDFMLKFSEYFIPKLQRTEVDLTTKGEKINFKDMSNEDLVKFVTSEK